MTIRVHITPPQGEPLVLDVAGECWVEPSGEAETTIGRDLWALPGLVDAHSHLAVARLDYGPGVFEEAIERARMALAHGVTLLIDKGWRDDTTIRVIDALEEAERPDIEAASVLLAAPGGYYPGFAREVAGRDLAAQVVNAAEEGRGWVKLVGDWPRRGVGPVANFTEAELRSAVESAATRGARVAIHTMAREVPSLAVAAGVQSIEHGLFLTEEDIAMLGGRAGMWVPTLLRVETTIAQLGETSSGGRLLEEGLANVRGLLGTAVEAGVHVLAGTDLVGTPADVADEALKLAEYGLGVDQMVGAVSSSAWAALGRPAPFTVGSPADVVLFPANPVTDPGVLRHPVMVVRRGRVV
ncbi:MAG: amidohydrolase family protein [Actinobacteria bacterium]|nr:amidohydrolase family protein [Actinomycetota bacterium]